ncbi:MAG: outer membrane protein assembly factor BamE [Gammaproteobacteria bacterium]|nr:outer membrane protein assembly factor BamE [Gammaproteobacteria bacterium]
MVTTAGCTLRNPFKVHRITIQQGNVVTQDMIDQLKPGMTREQVAFIMGEPVIRNTFDSDRWDYVYSIVIPGAYENKQLVSLYFIDEELSYFTGDLAPTAAQAE